MKTQISYRQKSLSFTNNIFLYIYITKPYLQSFNKIIQIPIIDNQ